MKKFFLIVLALVTLISIPVTVFYLGQQQELRKRAAPTTTLSFSPATANIKVGDMTTLNVQIDPGSNQVVAVKLNISYDATKLDAQSVTNGPLFPKILSAGIAGGGTISIDVAAESSAKPVITGGTVAIIRFKALALSDTPVLIQFTDQTVAAGIQENPSNVLSAKTSASVTILPSDISSGTHTITPTITIAQESTSSSMPTPTATHILTPTPTKPASASASAAITIIDPVQSAIVTDKPTIKGKAPPGSTVTIVIHSDTPITLTVRADANGNYTYTSATALSAGEHTVLVSATNPQTGNVETTEATFHVGSAGEESTGEAMPISGSSTMTIAALFSALVLVTLGVSIPVFIK